MKRVNPPFNFLGLEKAYSSFDKAKVVVLPVPYERTVTYGRGTSRGPRAIIDASRYLEFYDDELNKEFHKLGIHTLPEFKPRIGEAPHQFIPRLEKHIEKLLEKKSFIATLGGEHSITCAAARAYKKKHPKISVLHLDAHADLRKEYEGTPFSHACAMRRLIDSCPVVQVGIRSLSINEAKLIKKKRLPVFWARDIKAARTMAWMKRVVSKLSSKVYVTLDVDVFDPSLISFTGTPEPGGLDWEDVISLLRYVAGKRRIVGFDIVELAPGKQTHAPDFLTAKLAYKLMGYSFFKGR